MSKSKEIFEVAGGLIIITGSILVCLLIVKMSLGLYHGTVRAWWGLQGQHTTSAQQAAEKAAWATNPTNPEVIARHCLNNGGTPTFSAWDGNVTSCKGTDSKSANIEVNQ